jgi:hypothetical protein
MRLRISLNADLRAARKPGEPPRDPGADWWVVEAGWREAGLEVGGELHEVPARAVREADAL